MAAVLPTAAERRAFTKTLLVNIDLAYIESRKLGDPYFAGYWKKMIVDLGDGIVACLAMNSKDEVTGDVDGGLRLCMLGLERFTYEWTMLLPEWRHLFEEDQLERCRQTFVKWSEQTGRSILPPS